MLETGIIVGAGLLLAHFITKNPSPEPESEDSSSSSSDGWSGGSYEPSSPESSDSGTRQTTLNEF